MDTQLIVVCLLAAAINLIGTWLAIGGGETLVTDFRLVMLAG